MLRHPFQRTPDCGLGVGGPAALSAWRGRSDVRRFVSSKSQGLSFLIQIKNTDQ